MKLLEKVIDYNNKLSKKNIQTLVPVLYGYSGTGKTTIAHQYAKKNNLDISVILLHSTLSEEVCGLPRYNPINDKTVWTVPDWFDPDKPKVYFIDELDKVREDELGVLLTMFASKTIRNIPFPEGSVIICAMQPISPETWTETETGKALISRLLFIPIAENTTYSYLSNKYNIDLSFLPTDAIKAPILNKPNGRQLEYFLGLYQLAGKEETMEICKYLMPEAIMKALSEEIESKFGIDKKTYVSKLNEKPQLINNVDLYQVIENIGEIWHYGNSETVSEAMAKIILEGTFDEYSKTIENLYNYLKANISDEGTLEIVNGDSEEHFYEIFKKKMIKVNKILREREKKAQNKEEVNENAK